jgi:hypothetical protein
MVEFVSERMSYIILRGCWFYIIVLNIPAPTENEIDDVKNCFCKELCLHETGTDNGDRKVNFATS